MVLGNTAEMYLHGGQFFLQVIGVSLAYLATAYIVVPIIYPLKITSSFQVNYIKLFHYHKTILPYTIAYIQRVITQSLICFVSVMKS